MVSIPYAVRIIGTEYFGLVNFAAAFAGFFMIISDYGFNYTANRDIAKEKNNPSVCNELYNAVLILKTFLFAVCGAIFLVLVYFLNGPFENKTIFILSLGTLAGSALFPQWFLKGMEKMLYIAVPGIIIRTAVTLLIFVLVRQKDDYLIYAAILNGGNLLLGITGMVIVKAKYKYRMYMPSFKILRKNFVEGAEVFYSIVFTSIYNYANTFILGIFSDYRIVGLYAAADKVVTGVNGLINNLNESTYPRISALLSEDRKSGVNMIRASAKITALISLSFSVFTLVFAEPIVLIFFGKEFYNTIPLLRIMSFIPFFLAMNNLFGVQTILNLGRKKAFLGIIFISLCYFLVLSFILVPFLKASGTAAAIASTEFLVLLLMFLYIRKNKLLMNA